MHLKGIMKQRRLHDQLYACQYSTYIAIPTKIGNKCALVYCISRCRQPPLFHCYLFYGQI